MSNRTGHKLMDLSSETLQHFLKILPQKKGIEKNLLIKKFIKEIIYSKENIQINLYSMPEKFRYIASFSRNFTPQNFSDLNKRDGHLTS